VLPQEPQKVTVKGKPFSECCPVNRLGSPLAKRIDVDGTVQFVDAHDPVILRLSRQWQIEVCMEIKSAWS